MEEKELKKLQNKTLAQVCDGLAKVTEALKKDCKTKKQKIDLDKRAKTFKNFAKIFRNLNKGGKGVPPTDKSVGIPPTILWKKGI